jgi:uncharacterized protein YndB with AHSA1/START domain
MKNITTVERKSDRELVVTRTVNGPVRLVFEAWTRPELFQRWWVPKSAGLTLLSCEMDVRTGGKYRLVFEHGSGPMAFFGTYLEVVPRSRIVWTNEEAGEAGAISTATFLDRGDTTVVVFSELHPTKEALDAVIASGMEPGTRETFDQLDDFVTALAAAHS